MNENLFQMMAGMLPQQNQPPGPPMQLSGAPQAMGGLGGLGGLMQQQGGNIMHALGKSLMSSPRNNPMQGFGGALNSLAQAQQGGDQRKMLFELLKRAGFSDQEAQMYSSNPQLAQMAMQQRGAPNGG